MGKDKDYSSVDACYGDSGELTFEMPIITEEQEMVAQYVINRIVGIEPKVEFFPEDNDELRYIAKRMTGEELSDLFNMLGE